MKRLTVFTPTYNRAYTLPKLYKSLCEQTSKDFIWLIVDDGSTDNTKSLIKGWIINNPNICIQYYYQKNSGKMQAHNLGVQKTETELFVCVDSDDYLDPDSVEVIISYWDKIKSKNNNLCGIIGPRRMINADFESINTIPSDITFSTLSKLYKHGFRGETAIIFITKIIKQYKFPQIAGEKFITENYIYNQIDEKYLFGILKHYTINCEYLNDGYTKNAVKIKLNNPKGYSLYYNEMNKRTHSIYDICKITIFYIACSILSRYPFMKIIRNSNRKFYTLTLFPLGLILWIKYKYIKASNNNLVLKPNNDN